MCLREWFEGHDRSLEEGLDKRLVDVVNFLQLVEIHLVDALTTEQRIY